MKCKHLKDMEKVHERVDFYESGYVINGCCNGGCLVVTGIKFCPFCGEKLQEKR